MRTADVVRVFTKGDTGGNLLGVVTDLGGLDAASMQAIATYLGYSETIFIDAGEPRPVRIFTPATELPFAGHPLVGAAWSLGGSGSMVCGIGEAPFTADDDGSAVVLPMSRDVERADAGEIAAIASLPPPERAWWARMPIPYLLVEVADSGTVAAARPDIAALAATEAGEATLLFARAGGSVRARFFAPGLGVDEDPATGSAAVALASVLIDEGEATGSLIIDQGTEIGHPSRIGVSWSDGRVTLRGSVRPEASRQVP